MLEETVVNEEYIESMNKFREPDKNLGLIAACADNIVVFSEWMLGIRLRAWQVDFLNRVQLAMKEEYHTKEFAAITSRQVGKSHAVATLALWSTIFNKYPGSVHNSTSVGIISASDVQARKLLYEIKKLIRKGDFFMKEKYENQFGGEFFTSLLDENEPNNTTTVTFKPGNDITGELLKGSKGGSFIKSYPPTSSVLGETFSVLIEDEAGKTDKITDQFHYDYAYPTGNAYDAIRIYTSTPWESSGFFFKTVDPFNDREEHSSDRLLFTIEAIQIEDPKYYETVMKIVNTMNSEGNLDEVQRAYYCKFIQGTNNYFIPENIGPVFSEEYTLHDAFSKECDMGVDFGGQVKSRTVITISYLDEDGNIVRLYHRSYPVGKDLTLLDDMLELMKHFKIQRIIPDDCPAGDFLIRKMEEKGWNVHPMSFRADKVKKYGSFRALVNRGKVISYIDEDLKIEMFAMELSNRSRQSIIQHAPGYSDDLLDSFVMSAYFYLETDEDIRYWDIDDAEDTGWWT